MRPLLPLSLEGGEVEMFCEKALAGGGKKGSGFIAGDCDQIRISKDDGDE